MHSGRSLHQSGHQHRLVASEDYKVHEPRVEKMPIRLLDSPPYADLYKKSNNQRAKYKVDEEEEDVDAKADEFIKGKFGVVDYNQRGKFKVKEEEEIADAEADEFIKHEHDKFLRQKTMASGR